MGVSNGREKREKSAKIPITSIFQDHYNLMSNMLEKSRVTAKITQFIAPMVCLFQVSERKTYQNKV